MSKYTAVIKKNFNKSFIISLSEQLSLNGGNFLFFLISSILVGPRDFGMFSILWVGCQIIISISTPWISLPITSKSSDLDNKNIILIILKKVLKLSVFAPILLIVYKFVIEETILWAEVLVMYLMGLTLVLSESFRFFLVRQFKIVDSLIGNLIKWIVSFVFLFLLLNNTNFENYQIVFGSLMIGVFSSLLYQVFCLKSFLFNLKLKEKEEDVEMDFSLFHLGVSNLVNSICITVLFTKADLIVFGVFQAFKPLINFFPFILQYIESHYSSKLLKQGRKNFVSKKFLIFYLVICLFIVSLLFFFSEQLIHAIYGVKYSPYSYVFMFLFVIIAVQSLSRYINIQNRLENNNNVFNYSSYVLWFSSIIYVVIYYKEYFINTNIFFLVMIFTALLQFFVYYKGINLNSKKNKI